MNNLRFIPVLYRTQYELDISPTTDCYSIATPEHFFKKAEGYTQVLTQKIMNIVNPLDSYYQKRSGTIHTKMGYIKPLKQRDKGNKYHKGVIYRVVGVHCENTNNNTKTWTINTKT